MLRSVSSQVSLVVSSCSCVDDLRLILGPRAQPLVLQLANQEIIFLLATHDNFLASEDREVVSTQSFKLSFAI